MSKHYVLEVKITEVENTPGSTKWEGSRHVPVPGERKQNTIVNLHLTSDVLAKAIGQAAEHLMVVGKAHYGEEIATIKEVAKHVPVPPIQPPHSEVGIRRPIKDNPQA